MGDALRRTISDRPHRGQRAKRAASRRHSIMAKAFPARDQGVVTPVRYNYNPRARGGAQWPRAAARAAK